LPRPQQQQQQHSATFPAPAAAPGVVILGTCLEMCPKAEQDIRIENKMVHYLELMPKRRSSDQSLSSAAAASITSVQQDELRRPKMVKQFSRSAAGEAKTCRPEELRPAHICRRTTNHLISQIFLPRFPASFSRKNSNLTENSLKSVYDFVFDRLRSVRQDLAVQQVRDAVRVHVLEVCVKFHLLCGYHFLSGRHSDSGNPDSPPVFFDQHINFSHLLECLKTVLALHEDLAYPDDDTLVGEMVAVYLLVNLGSSHSLSWTLEKSVVRSYSGAGDEAEEHRKKKRILSPMVKLALRINKLYLQRNFVAMFRAIDKLTLFPLIAIHWKTPHIYAEILSVMSVAYNSKVLKYPLAHFAALYAADDDDDDATGDDDDKGGKKDAVAGKISTAERICQEHNVTVVRVTKEDGDEAKIAFSKADFKLNEKPSWHPMPKIESLLRNVDLERIFTARNDQL